MTQPLHRGHTRLAKELQTAELKHQLAIQRHEDEVADLCLGRCFFMFQIRSTFWRCFVCCCVLHDFTTLAILLPWILVHPFKLVHLWHRSVRVNCQEISIRCPSQEPLGIKSHAISHGLQLLQVGMCMCHITVWSYRPYRYILVITHVLI